MVHRFEAAYAGQYYSQASDDVARPMTRCAYREGLRNNEAAIHRFHFKLLRAWAHRGRYLGHVLCQPRSASTNPRMLSGKLGERNMRKRVERELEVLVKVGSPGRAGVTALGACGLGRYLHASGASTSP